MKRRRSEARYATAPGLAGTMTTPGIAGTWEWDPATGCFILDEGAAELMAGDAGLAGHPLRGERATAGLDASAAARFLGDVRHAAGQEDDVAVDLWVPSLSGPKRRLLCRGRIHRDARQHPVRGEGKLIDTADPGVQARTLHELESAAAADAVDEAAELIIAARRAIDASGKPRLRQLVDVLLLEIAREIASRSSDVDRQQH
ncbi:hypothetical protein [Methylorubrum sp. Q1]|uniref:hypothetical protein n=1 Tax=Methylorubrum sp. Q1 TaxID=2562453 RepID=UPI001FE0EC24|nr:hypothetical protein [Methylorubrum sp. Q1]